MVLDILVMVHWWNQEPCSFLWKYVCSLINLLLAELTKIFKNKYVSIINMVSCLITKIVWPLSLKWWILQFCSMPRSLSASSPLGSSSSRPLGKWNIDFRYSLNEDNIRIYERWNLICMHVKHVMTRLNNAFLNLYWAMDNEHYATLSPKWYDIISHGKKFLTTFLFVPSCAVEENKLKIDVSIQREHSKISTVFCHSALEAHT
jgi:hypothetical protein